jgi:hypothetical protein
MKGTVLRPDWPTPPKKKADPKAASTQEPELRGRITLALMDEYSERKGKGYDPYNTDVGKRRDVWCRKPKRD